MQHVSDRDQSRSIEPPGVVAGWFETVTVHSENGVNPFVRTIRKIVWHLTQLLVVARAVRQLLQQSERETDAAAAT